MRKVLISIVAYYEEKTIVEVLERVPEALSTQYTPTALFIDDIS
jgi:hypothetical protein